MLRNIRHFSNAVDPDAFRDEGEFEDDLGEHSRYVTAQRISRCPAVLVAGDPDRAAMDGMRPERYSRSG